MDSVLNDNASVASDRKLLPGHWSWKTEAELSTMHFTAKDSTEFRDAISHLRISTVLEEHAGIEYERCFIDLLNENEELIDINKRNTVFKIAKIWAMHERRHATIMSQILEKLDADFPIIDITQKFRTQAVEKCLLEGDSMIHSHEWAIKCAASILNIHKISSPSLHPLYLELLERLLVETFTTSIYPWAAKNTTNSFLQDTFDKMSKDENAHIRMLLNIRKFLPTEFQYPSEEFFYSLVSLMKKYPSIVKYAPQWISLINKDYRLAKNICYRQSNEII